MEVSGDFSLLKTCELKTKIIISEIKVRISEKQPKNVCIRKRISFFLVCMHKMCSEGEELIEEGEITVKAYTKNKITMKKRGCNDFYAI